MPLGNILFRVNAGPKIGLGHLQRSLSLAIEFRKAGVVCSFLTNAGNLQLSRIARLGFEATSLPNIRSWSSEDITETIKAKERLNCIGVVVDSHEVRQNYLSGLKNAGCFVISRDDLALFPFESQLVINGNADAERLPYYSGTGDTIFLLGTDYIVLRDEFQTVAPKPIRTNIQNLLITLGGTDHHNLMPQILATVDQLPGEFNVTAVVGPFFVNIDAVNFQASESQNPVSVVSNPDSMRDLMLNADLAISAAGQTLYELANVGCPTVTISVVPNQRSQVTALSESEALIYAGDTTNDDILANLKNHLTNLLSDQEMRAKMSAIGQQLVDGQGAIRVVRNILEHTSSLKQF